MYLPQEDSYFLSEQLEKLLKKIKNKSIRILDLGSGSGIQAETCLNSGFHNIFCIDVDKEAVEHLKEKFKNKENSEKEEDEGRKKIESREKSSLTTKNNKHKTDKLKPIQVIQSNLFSKLNKDEKFNLIIFNPPYLPKNKYDKQKDTSGGKQGDETILKFLNQSKRYLDKKGKIILLLSSLTPKLKINNLIKKLKLKKRRIAEKKLFFERLELFLIE